MAQNLFVLYVRNQSASRDFYAHVLGQEPVLDVPGMTEFDLGGGALLGLMPEAGIARLLGGAIEAPNGGAPRAEVYLVRADAEAMHARALEAGARELSAVAPRDWGERVGYVADPDGHVLAFAVPTAP